MGQPCRSSLLISSDRLRHPGSLVRGGGHPCICEGPQVLDQTKRLSSRSVSIEMSRNFRGCRHAVKSSSTTEINLTAMNEGLQIYPLKGLYPTSSYEIDPSFEAISKSIRLLNYPSHSPSELCDIIVDWWHTSGKILQMACNDSTQLSISHLVIK